MVLTSPPYGNLEVYENMMPFKDDEEYYKELLIPMIEMCRTRVWVCRPVWINISPKIYETLTGKYGFRECDEKINFLQQMGQQMGKKQDYVYVWREEDPEC